MKNQQISYQLRVGKLEMPTIKGLEAKFGTQTYQQIQAMFSAMFHRYLIKGAHLTPTGAVTHSVAMPYWAKRINNPKAHNIALKVLSKAGWITVSTRPNNNWSEAYINESKLLEYVTKEELDSTRMYHKFMDYKLSNTQSTTTNAVVQNGAKLKSTLTRTGFQKAGNVEFQYNTNQIYNYFKDVLIEVNKGIEKMILKYPQIATDHANYKELGREVLEYLSTQNATYTSGERTSDFRGRDIAGYLSKIGNPIGFKVMRSMLVIPEQYRNIATPRGLRNKYLFIAELTGFKKGTKLAKFTAGNKAYANKTLTGDLVHDLWLENTYADIDAYYNTPNHKWIYPIEIDMSASILGYIGLLLNHKPFLDRCNILPGDLSDAWGHDIITNRDQMKTTMRRCYGSQMSAVDMWRDMDIEFTQDQVNTFEYELEYGEMAVANRLKDFIINNSIMKPEMTVRVFNETLNFSCNKFHNVGEKTTQYDLWDSHTQSIRRIHNTQTTRKPDLKSFKRVGPTTLIHGLDSQVENNTCDAVIDEYGFCLPIHDALILCAEAAHYGREIYSNGRTPDEPSLKSIYTNRNTILSNFFNDLGIKGSKIAEFKSEVLAYAEPLTEPLEINSMVLK
jgi:hypothetical protein